MPLLANLGNPDGALDAVALGAEGVGLFRTEFLFLSSSSAPTIEQQREAYTKLLSAFPGKKVVVRVLDAGADKPLPFLNDAHEENPALGLRGIRALRASEDILREQLTALAEATRRRSRRRTARRSLGHGAHGRHRRGDRVLHDDGPGLRHPYRGRHGRGAL